MSADFAIPPLGFGPGSQPGTVDEGALEYMPMPAAMRAFEYHAPEVEDASVAEAVCRFLGRLGDACSAGAATGAPARLSLKGESAAIRAAIDDALGEGEVSVLIPASGAAPSVEAQEAAFAGVWRVRSEEGGHIEVGAVPAAVTERAFETARVPARLPASGEGIVNAPAILIELFEKAAGFEAGAPPHVVNLTLLPHTPEDLDYLARVLAPGSVTLLSRGYGNCRIESTGTPNVWRVRYFNSQDTMILDTIEVGGVPDAARAAREDFEDSAERIAEVIEALS